MNPHVVRLLRACRNATRYKGPRWRWKAGTVRDESYSNYPFKPGHVPATGLGASAAEIEQDAKAAAGWCGDFDTWDFVLNNARVGHRIDFYVYSVSRSGTELETNVGIKLVTDTEAVVCDCGNEPFTVSISKSQAT